jgi:hypothetical protein
VCHTLFGRGATVGPELTGLERADLPKMLLNILARTGDDDAGAEQLTVGAVASFLCVRYPKRIFNGSASSDSSCHCATPRSAPEYSAA